MSISTECMVVNLQIHMWSGQRLDRDASRRVTEDAGADADAARVNKHLVPKAAIKPVQQAATALRAHFYDNTLPWKDSGDRILTRRRYTAFVEGHEDLVRKFHETRDIFLTKDYLSARERAAFRMGDLFNPDDYPSVDRLRHKFQVHLDIDTVTEGKDFRVAIANAGDLQAEIERKKVDRLSKAMTHMWSRLADTLGHFADKMASDGIFRDTTVTNLEELVAIIPDMNLLDDPDLEAIRQEIAAKLVGYDPKDLRKKPEVRSEAATEAARIMAQMRGYMSAAQAAA